MTETIMTETTTTDKLRIYAVSMIAFSNTETMHIPALIPAESIHVAAKASSFEAHRRWPIAGGWWGHHVCIQPVTKQFYDASLIALEAGCILEDSDEDPACFPLEEPDPNSENPIVAWPDLIG